MILSFISRDWTPKKGPIATGIIVTLLIVAMIALFLSFKAKTVQEFRQIQSVQSNNTVFFDIDNQPFHVIRGIEDRKYVKLNTIGRKLLVSVVAIEDSRFYQHFGFDPIRIAAVVLRLFKRKASLQGASTITQQLVKLTLLSSETTLKRKVTEILMAVVLEMEYSKAELLEFYLNKVYLGHGNYGVENASLNYFHKSTGDLTLAESAFIAGLIKKPEGYSPFKNLKKAWYRQRLVFKRLRTLKWISKQEYLDAVKERILIRRQRPSNYQMAPYFTNHILLQLKRKYGHSTIYGGGLRIYTTLDRKLQSTMKQVVEKRFTHPRSFEEVAGVSLDPATGHVKALVGGIDFSKSEFNRVTQAKRQPGSAFKPILYATAFSEGIRPTDVFWDEPTPYTSLLGDETEVYEPGNFSGDHLGPITASYALRVSNNVVSVQILDKISIKKLVRAARQFGLELPGERGLCLALGCGETTLLNLASAYSVFANNGFRQKPVFVLKVTDRHGKVLEKYRQEPNIQVLSKNQAYQMNRMLQDVVNFGTGRNAKISRISGGKTGTSDLNKDAWYIGYTPELVSGFWVGNDDNTPMDEEVGGRTPAQLWRSYMMAKPVSDLEESFAINENFDEYLICDHSGKLATAVCPDATWYGLKKDEAPRETCDIHSEEQMEIQICGSSGKLANRYCPIDEIETKNFFSGTEPTEFCDIHGHEETYGIDITPNSSKTDPFPSQ